MQPDCCTRGSGDGPRRIEARIRDRYGTGRPRCPGLVVATQVVEVSLDVDFDTLHTSGAPLEALHPAIRPGQPARHPRPPADVVVHAPRYRAARGTVHPSTPTASTGAEPPGWPGRSWTGTTAAEPRRTGPCGSGWTTFYDTAWGERWRQPRRPPSPQLRGQHFLAFSSPSMTGKPRRAISTSSSTAPRRSSKRTGRQLCPGASRTSRGKVAASWVRGSPAAQLRLRESLGRYDKDLKVTVIDGDYDPLRGLGASGGRVADRYQPGEVL